MTTESKTNNTATIGLVSVSDRASGGAYEDAGIPALTGWLTAALQTPCNFIDRLIPDDEATIRNTLSELVDSHGCDLILTTGGTGPAPRDVTPEATRAVGERELLGFGERMRAISLKYVPTAILSRQTAVIRRQCLIINLPGQPKAIAETLDELFPAIPYCLDLIGACYLQTNENVVRAFRPKSAAQKSVAHNESTAQQNESNTARRDS